MLCVCFLYIYIHINTHIHMNIYIYTNVYLYIYILNSSTYTYVYVYMRYIRIYGAAQQNQEHELGVCLGISDEKFSLLRRTRPSLSHWSVAGFALLSLHLFINLYIHTGMYVCIYIYQHVCNSFVYFCIPGRQTQAKSGPKLPTKAQKAIALHTFGIQVCVAVPVKYLSFLWVSL